MASGGFVVLAGFRLQAGPRGRFPEADRADTEASVRDEFGCRHFDVLITDEVPDKVPPHEVHDDAAALAAHLSSSRSATPGRSGPGGER